MLKRLLIGLYSGLLAAVLPACDSVNLEKIRPGRTTMQEVHQIMGPPTTEWLDNDGTTTWEYPRTPNGIVNYMIDFGPDKIVREVRQILTEENFANVREGMTREQIRRLLGKPAHEFYFSLKKEHVWDWKTKEEAGYTHFFNVHFDESGHVVRTSTNFVAVSGG
ncbi:outer membrane protein assembly factor BamE domain-containing protein [Propionivibrio limicola]|uniref:outer membrane protein assembly factor BamE domain-containing protein n=1 Tax=Propionivibrio limicola TaxID=167645 RepID=UPI0014781076|nr:outer membrane protein assembly factor BamE [Propionivibrio limicola]